MTAKPLRKCLHPACHKLTTNSRCDNHAAQHAATDIARYRRAYDDKRGTASERGYDHRWSKYRLGFLRKNPLCVRCKTQGYITPASVVDHVIPARTGHPFWDKDNHQALCKRCHDIKTHTEDSRVWGVVKK